MAINDLQEQVETRRRDIRTDGYAMSIGELVSLYEDGELDIRPRFQRFFRWTDEQKTNLIESILLGIPLPQIFISARDDGTWEVVDGMQRLSTILSFMGKLKDENNNLQGSLTLSEAKYLPALKDMIWEHLPRPLAIDFRRSKMNLSIMKRDGDSGAKYDLFQRLNTGGTSLTEQEVRNCILIMENESFYNWLEALVNYPAFKDCVSLSDRLTDEGYHMELISRFMILCREDEISIRGDLGPYVNEKLLEMARTGPGDWERWKIVFQNTFDILNASNLGDLVFRRYSSQDDRFKGSFLISPFEIVGCGIAYNISRGTRPEVYSSEWVLQKVKELWSGNQVGGRFSVGRNPANRLKHTIPLGREWFQCH